MFYAYYIYETIERKREKLWKKKKTNEREVNNLRDKEFKKW